jgi:hypothetical protein
LGEDEKGTESLLDDYLVKVRSAQASLEGSAIRQRVHEIFDELRLQYRVEEEIWQIESDVGPVQAGLSEDEDVLSFWQVIHELKAKPKRSGEYFHALLSANADMTGGW